MPLLNIIFLIGFVIVIVLILITFVPSISRSFWPSQFHASISTSRIVFDIVAGIVAPIFCLVIDPGVFRWIDDHIGCLLCTCQIFAYLSVGLGILLLGIKLLFGAKLTFLNGMLAGIFLYGALFAVAIGLMLLPFSLFGLLFILGILGFIPFVVAFVFLRNGIVAFREATRSMSKRQLALHMSIGVILVIALPTLAQPGWNIYRR